MNRVERVTVLSISIRHLTTVTTKAEVSQELDKEAISRPRREAALLWGSNPGADVPFNYTLESLYKTQVGSHFHHITFGP